MCDAPQGSAFQRLLIRPFGQTTTVLTRLDLKKHPFLENRIGVVTKSIFCYLYLLNEFPPSDFCWPYYMDPCFCNVALKIIPVTLISAKSLIRVRHHMYDSNFGTAATMWFWTQFKAFLVIKTLHYLRSIYLNNQFYLYKLIHHLVFSQLLLSHLFTRHRPGQL